jgi:hypothetical protein
MRPVSFASFLMRRVVWQATKSFLRPRSRANFYHFLWLWHELDDREIGRGKRLVSYLRVQTGCGAHRISTPNVTAVFIFIFLCSIHIVHFVEFYSICPTNARHMKLYVSYSPPIYFDVLYIILREFIIMYSKVTKLIKWKHLHRCLLQRINRIKTLKRHKMFQVAYNS